MHYIDTQALRKSVFCVILGFIGYLYLSPDPYFGIPISFGFGVIIYFAFSYVDYIPKSEVEIYELIDYAEGFEENTGKLLEIEYIEIE
jgi:hypothetical protein